MQFSLSTEYAIHSLFYLAIESRSGPVLVSEVAKVQNISESYLAKIFQTLTKAGLVRSFRGAKGGYSLAIDSDSITLKQIVETMEGKSPIFVCNDKKRNCTIFPDCIIHDVMDEAKDRMYEVLNNTTLGDLVINYNKSLKNHIDTTGNNGTGKLWLLRRSG